MGRQSPSRVRIPPSPLAVAARLLSRSAPVAQLDRASVYGTEGQRFESSRARSTTSRRETLLGEKQEAKRRRRENREERERQKASRTGDSPAQDAEALRRRNATDPEDAARRA